MNNGKAKIEAGTYGPVISVPSKKNWFVLVFATIWFGGWVVGFVSASYMLMSFGPEENGPVGFVAIWLAAWTLAGAAVLFILFWGYFGKEHFISEKEEIIFEKTVFNVGKKAKLERQELKNFRTHFNSGSWFSGSRWAIWGLGPGQIKFDYGLKTYSFGLGVDEAEAAHIVELLKNEFETERSKSV